MAFEVENAVRLRSRRKGEPCGLLSPETETAAGAWGCPVIVTPALFAHL